MNNVEFAEKIGGYLKGSKAKAKKYEDNIFVNFTFIDDMDDFYVSVKEGILEVAPYHYNDFLANVTGSAENIEKLFTGEISFDKAINDGLVKVDGNDAKFKALEALVPAKKAAEKTEKKAPAKAAAKAEQAPAAEEKPVAEEKAAEPAEAPKAEEKVAPAVKEAVKPAAKNTPAKTTRKKCGRKSKK